MSPVLPPRIAMITFGNCIAKIDPFGAETLYAYDVAGNQTEVTHPLMANETASLIRPKETFTYDAARNVTSSTSLKGDATLTRYNSRNQLIHAQYPDGTTERNTNISPMAG